MYKVEPMIVHQLNIFKFFNILVLLLSFSQSGCYTTSVSVEEADLIPVARLLAYQNIEDTEKGRVTVIRDGEVVGPECFLENYVNQKLAARIGESEKGTFYLSPGPLLVGIATDLEGKPWCGYDPGNSTQIQTTIGPDEVKVFRISLGVGGTIHLARD